MATILEFPSRTTAAQGRRKVGKQSAASAEIVIFPGVRIERWDETASPRKARRQRATSSRDTLDLLD